MRNRLEKVQKFFFDLLENFENFFEKFFFQSRQTKVTPLERGSNTKQKCVNLFFFNLIQSEIIEFQRQKTTIFAFEARFHLFASMAVRNFIALRDPLNKTTQHIFFRGQLSAHLRSEITRRMRAIPPRRKTVHAYVRSTDDLKGRESDTNRKRIKN